jgi:hypothetical protein
MTDVAPAFVSPKPGDAPKFIGIVQNVAAGLTRECQPELLYVVRIDNWFGPKWMHFAGKFTAGKGASIGVHKTTLHVPPFVPHRVVAERVFVGPDYEKTVVRPPLHIECPSKQALTRRIEDIDKDAAFLWFSSESEIQKRGAVMVYLPVATETSASRRRGLHECGAFYAGYSKRETSWELAMLGGISRAEVAHLEALGKGAELEKIG